MLLRAVRIHCTAGYALKYARATVMSDETVRMKGPSAPEPSIAVPEPSGEPFGDIYLDRGEFARGGMASLHRVYDRTLLRTVAMKVLDPHLAEDRTQLETFVAEAQIVAQLDHPNIVPVHQVGTGPGGERYFTMKLVSGTTLEALLEESSELAVRSGKLDELLGILVKVCEGIAFAHNRGVVHCDLKPGNVMVGSFGQVYVMDWGIARLIGSRTPTDDPDNEPVRAVLPPAARGAIAGSPSYMAPEQARGEDIDARTDVYAIGAILYEILTGRPPHVADSPYAVLVRAATQDVAPPSTVVSSALLPEGLCRIAMRALSRVPSQRYADALELKRDLEEFMRGVPMLPTRVFAAGQVIVHEGDPGNLAYVIVKGQCQAYKTVDGQKVVQRTMGPGDVFGELAVLSNGRRSASIEAVDEMTVMIVSRDAITEGLGLHTWMGSFVRALAMRFQELDKRLSDPGTAPPKNSLPPAPR